VTIGFNELCLLSGGIVLFLYGLSLASENLKAVSGNYLKVIIKLLTANRFLGMLAGVGGTVLVQSNTATAVILIGLCTAGVLTLTRSIGVLLGANLGSTVTVQFIAFDLYAYALLLIAIGFLGTLKIKRPLQKKLGIFLVATGAILIQQNLASIGIIIIISGFSQFALSYISERKAAGMALMGFGLIFVGMKVIKSAMVILQNDPTFSDLIVKFQNYPILVILLALIFTVLTNSSTATLGTAIALVSSGGSELLSPEGTVAIVMGAHLGSCPMAFLSSTGAGRVARQVSATHIFIKIAGVILVYPLLEPFSHMLVSFNDWTGATPARAVANAHSLFNIVNVLSLIPFTNQIAQFIEKLIPKKEKEKETILRYLSEEQMEYQPMAMDSVELEVKRLSFKVRDIVAIMKSSLDESQLSNIRKIRTKDKEINELFTSILEFLSGMGKSKLGAENFQRVLTLVYVITNLERIGDLISKDFSLIMTKRIEEDIQFSFEGLKLLTATHVTILEDMNLIIKILSERDASSIHKILGRRDQFLKQTRLLKKAHFKQLIKKVKEAEEASMIYLDTLSSMRDVHQAIYDIAENLKYCPYYGNSPSNGQIAPLEIPAQEIDQHPPVEIPAEEQNLKSETLEGP
jgi:phosphate:Na+ symporter